MLANNFSLLALTFAGLTAGGNKIFDLICPLELVDMVVLLRLMKGWCLPDEESTCPPVMLRW